jgi:Dna[CI] antecedent, DciA
MEEIASGLQRIKAALLRDCDPKDAPAIAWPMICGSRVAEKAEVCGFENGVLTIVVPDNGWRAELASLAPRYLVGLNKISPVKIESLVFITREALQLRDALRSKDKI